ncbi:nickel-binding protein [Ferruginibacter albus]|uniref:nickel-binding protein n=1 Tax=Ferruginibacter albus TaxID=2875540 RepID=UPI001CC5AB08|nr:nickel-binding protein [Ferruginibacter albus]UAY50873.1 DUF4242 domain-containing protein [Ferruginibacter albus]
MPLYMDQHILPGVKAKDVAEAHQMDMLIQHDHSCNCITYWIDEKRGNVFCLIEAPSKEAVQALHGQSHGLVPNKVIEVNSSIVESFLGRITDPEDVVMQDGLKVFNNTSFRILMVVRISDVALLQQQLGRSKTNELIVQYNTALRKILTEHGGREIENDKNDFVISFTATNKAIACALEINDALSVINDLGWKIAVSAGDPVANNEQLFGDTIQLAERMLSIIKDAPILISSNVKDLLAKEYIDNAAIHVLSPADEELLNALFNTLEENWQENDFSIEDYCASIAMSKSQLYRKTLALSGLSPNLFLKEFRLQKAKELLKKQRNNISEITFNTGFTSPSYFTKCFKKKFGITPLAYLEEIL